MSDMLAEAAGITRDRPRADGAIIGEAIAALADAGRINQPDLPDPCATCAFRRGCMTNLMPATVLTAFRCATGADDSPFGCHHGMVDGQPAKKCAGWMAAQAADWLDVDRILAKLGSDMEALDDSAHDPIREQYDVWANRIDPAGQMDDYQRGRLWLARDRRKIA